MSQHDYDITTADANSGVSFRAAVNAAFQAGQTLNSGDTAPATTYAYQLWAESDSGTLWQRNGTNTGWIARWTLTGDAMSFPTLVNFAPGADIASATTLDLTAATGNFPRITGTNATSAVTMNAGQQMLLIADGAWPLTYNATTNKINTGGTNYTLTAGDVVLYHKDLAGVVHGNILSSRLRRIKLLTGNTRDRTASTGNVSYTGVGFKPTKITAYASVAGLRIKSTGLTDGSSTISLATAALATSDDTINGLVAIIDAGNNQIATLVSMDSDGFTLTWTKSGSPSAGTIKLSFMCEE